MKYRSEIDGLRAVAVVPVILFHAGFPLFSGGYVGVDVFFVISGYLITTILIEELQAGQFSLVQFYERRARRILPALLFMLLCCIPVAWVWMLPLQFKDFSQGLVAVGFFASNILFWYKTDYFAPAAEHNPLLHTWSLAVEEQFYIVFPLLLLLVWRQGNLRVTWAIVVVCAFSFAAAEWGWRNTPAANFYMIHTRAWELGIGALCAFGSRSSKLLPNVGFSALGLGMIVFAVFAYDSATPFPSFYAMAPVLGAALIILFARSDTGIGRLLSFRWVVGIGLISYSTYLWHQPLFAFARIRGLGHVDDTTMLALSVFSVVIGWISWRYVERPFRNGGRAFPKRAELFAASGLGLATCIAFGMYGHLTEGRKAAWMRSMDSAGAQVAAFLDYTDTADTASQLADSGCFFSGNTGNITEYRAETCLALETASPNYILMGDSHASHFANALAEYYPDVNWLQASASGCMPFKNPSEGQQPCIEMHQLAFDLLETSPRSIDGVVLSARWSMTQDYDGLRRTINHLSGLGLRVVVLGPTVEYTTDLPAILARMVVATGQIPERIDAFFGDRPETEKTIESISRDAGAAYVSIRQIICDEEGCRTFSEENEPMQFDTSHFTRTGASTVLRRGFPPDLNQLFNVDATMPVENSD